MIFQKQYWHGLVALAISVLLGLVACGGSGQTEVVVSETAVSAIPELVIDVSEAGFSVPEVVPGGIVSISIHNVGTQPHNPNLWRIQEGHTRDEIVAMNNHLKEAPDDFFGIFEIGSWIHFVENVEPDATYHFYADLGTGEFFLTDDANPELDPTFFAATEVVGTVEPEAAVTMDMVDFAYTMPDVVPAGKQLWEVTNSGEQWHLFAIMKANPELSAEALLAGFGDESGPPTDSPVELLGGMPPMSPGEHVWLEFDLAAGAYEVVCPLPDVTAFATGSEPLPHLLHGMRHAFAVGN